MLLVVLFIYFFFEYHSGGAGCGSSDGRLDSSKGFVRLVVRFASVVVLFSCFLTTLSAVFAEGCVFIVG